MGGAGKLVIVAIGGGLAVTLAIVAISDPPPPGAPVPQISGTGAQLELGDTLRRCRTVTVPDPECEAAWEARREQFFGREKDEQ